MIKRTERGWAGHFIVSDKCLFRRNTLIEYNDVKIVVSTVGGLTDPFQEKKFLEIGCQCFYETMAFHAKAGDSIYNDADVSREVCFESKWRINHIGETADYEANQMHDAVVEEISERLLNGENL